MNQLGVMPLDSLDTLQTIDKQFHCHPFTDHGAMHTTGTSVLVSATGCYVTDHCGRRFLDALAGLWCVNIGYGRKELADAVSEQIAMLSFYPSFFNSTTVPAIKLAEKLAALAPAPLSHSFFCNSGSEANESAIKIILAYNHSQGRFEKRKFLSRSYAYHGVTLGSTSLTGLTPCHTAFGLPLADFIHTPTPYSWEAGRTDPEQLAEECLEQTRQIIEREGAHTIAALFAEPIQGAGGVIVPPPGYLKKLRDLCFEYDILFVADEVITGFGRLGAWFASELYDLRPDLCTLAKGITSGYVPLGAVMFSDKIATVLNQGGVFSHGFTYSGHPVATRAALVNIEILEREKLPERVQTVIGPYFQRSISELSAHPAVGEVRGEGLIAAIELLPEAGRSALRPELALGTQVAAFAREEGVIVRGIRNMIALAPPLIITEQEVDELVAALFRALDAFQKQA